jgi:uncharacterized membrane protein (DUF4010 family)
MDPMDPLLRLGAALAVGFLIGFERGWRKRDDPEGSRPAGLRTFALIGLGGGLAGVLVGEFREALGALVIGAGFLAVATLLAAMYCMSSRAGGDLGATTEFAALVTYLLGVLAGSGVVVPALAAGLVTVALLDTKAPLHGLLQRVSHDELRSALKLLLVSAVLLPILPNQGYGPGRVLNPYQLWWIVVLVAGLALLGHFLRRLAGPSLGPLLTGLVGGLASSTAVTVSAARHSTRHRGSYSPQAGCVSAAQAVMALRILIVAGVLNPSLMAVLILPLGAAALVSFACAYWYGRPVDKQSSAAEHDKEKTALERAPDDLGTALIFAVILAAVMLATHYARGWLGISGLYATAALAGLIDVDAIEGQFSGVKRRTGGSTCGMLSTCSPERVWTWSEPAGLKLERSRSTLVPRLWSAAHIVPASQCALGCRTLFDFIARLAVESGVAAARLCQASGLCGATRGRCDARMDLRIGHHGQNEIFA